ncbi:Magnetosome protein MamH [Azospirillaceae bacterium]
MATTSSSYRWNALYLVSAVAMISMTLAAALQPLFLRKVLGVSLNNAGTINANVEVVAELVALLVIGSLGALSDRIGRTPILVGGFLVGAFGSALALFSIAIGTATGLSGVVIYYLARIVMSLGACAIWPQIIILSGDFADSENRARKMSNTASMTAFGSVLVFAVLMQTPRHIGVIPVVFFNALLGLIGAWLASRLLIDVVPKQQSALPSRRIIKDILIREPRIRAAFIAALFSRGNVAATGLFYMLWTVYFADLVGKSQEQAAAHAGLVIGLVGLLLMATSIGWGVVVDFLGRLNAIRIGMAISGAGFLMMTLVVNPFDLFVYIPMSLIALGQVGVLLAPDVIVIDHTPDHLRGAMMGALNITGGIGLIFVLEVGGALFDTVGPYAPFAVIGVGNILVSMYTWWTAQIKTPPES